MPPMQTFRRWLETGGKRGLKHKITSASNLGSTKKKFRKAKCPELDDLVGNFTNRSEALLSEYGIGLSWSVVREQARHFAIELN